MIGVSEENQATLQKIKTEHEIKRQNSKILKDEKQEGYDPRILEKFMFSVKEAQIQVEKD